MKKRLLGLLLACVMIVGLLPMGVMAADTQPVTADITVTISDKGVLAKANDGSVMASREVTVTDLNGDAKLTVDEALTAAHKAYKTEDAYQVTESNYGASVTKLWGEETSNTLFFVNNAGIPMGVTADTVKAGDTLTASINADNVSYADWYTFFTEGTKTAEVGQPITLTLQGHLGMAYEEKDKVDRAIPDAEVGVWTSGEAAAYTSLDLKTNADGQVQVSFPEAGTYYVTASGTVKAQVQDWSQGGALVEKLCPMIAPVCVVHVTNSLTAVGDSIAAKYAESGVAEDGNGPWLAADMAAYQNANPDTAYRLNEEQKQAMADKAIAALKTTKAPGDLAKYSLALVAMGYDPTKLTTAENEPLDAVGKLVDMIREKNGQTTSTWTIPVELMTLRLFGSTYQDAIDILVASAMEQKSNWMNTQFGTDGMAMMVPALAPYASVEGVQEALDLAKKGINDYQQKNADGSLGNAASTGLGVVAMAAMGEDPALCKNTETGKSLVDGLKSFVTETGDGFVEPYGGSFNTEQGFRGCIALAGAEAGTPYHLYTFSTQDLKPVTERYIQENARVQIRVMPEDAVLEVKSGETVQPYVKAIDGYDLPAGDYSYTVSREGYAAKQGTFTVTEEEASGHSTKKLAVSLATAQSTDSTAPQVTVQVNVKVHDAETCHNKCTYKYHADQYTDLTAQTVSLGQGATAFDAMDAALTEANISYSEENFGYIDAINGLSELDHGAYSGWLYQVNREFPQEGCRDYVLNDGDTVTWFYTDDYSLEFDPGIFTDIDTHWAKDAIDYVYQKELMNGVTDTVFRPEGTTTRGMIAAILYRMEGEPTVTEPPMFSDVSSKRYYADPIQWAVTNKIMVGYGDHTFGPENPVTREQMATVFYRYSAYKKLDVSKTADLSRYPDAGQVHDWAAAAMSWANGEKLIVGTDKNLLRPQGQATRAQVATILMRYLENIAE